MMVKLNSRQCDGFIAIVTEIYTIAHFLFVFIYIRGKQMSVILTLKVVLIYSFPEKKCYNLQKIYF